MYHTFICSYKATRRPTKPRIPAAATGTSVGIANALEDFEEPPEAPAPEAVEEPYDGQSVSFMVRHQIETYTPTTSTSRSTRHSRSPIRRRITRCIADRRCQIHEDYRPVTQNRRI